MLPVSPAAALSNHTAVSGLGNDTNPCTVAQPCRTMQMAYSNTAVGGEIDVLDPTGYGALVITHAISIEGHGWASMNATATGSAITINAGPNDAISLHGLILDGLGIGQSGIVANSCRSFELGDSIVRNFTGGGIAINMTSSFCVTSIVNTSVTDNKGTGVSIKTGAGSGGTVTATLDRVLFKNNGANGFTADASAGGGIRATISDSTFNFNAAIGVSAIGGSSGVFIALVRDVISNHPIGAKADASAGVASLIFQSCVVHTSSTLHLQSVGNGFLISFGGNVLFDGAGTFNVTQSPT
jgi:hypothetical protein